MQKIISVLHLNANVHKTLTKKNQWFSSLFFFLINNYNPYSFYLQNFWVYRYLHWSKFNHLVLCLKPRKYKKLKFYFGGKKVKLKQRFKRRRTKGLFLRVHWKYKEKFYKKKFLFRILKRSIKLGKLIKRLKRRLRKLHKKKTVANWFFSFLHYKLRLKQRTAVNYLKYYLQTHTVLRKQKLSTWKLRRKIFMTSKALMFFFIAALYKPTLNRPRPRRRRWGLKKLFPGEFFPAKSNTKKMNKYSLPKRQRYKRFVKFYKKKQNKKLIFYDCDQSLILKMRSARIAHWNIRTKGKLNEWRYDKLLGRELGMYLNFFKKQLLNVIFVSLYCCQLSWKQHQWFINSNLVIVNSSVSTLKSILKKGDIVELPYGFAFEKTKHKWRTKWRRRWRNIRRFAYKHKFWYKKKPLKTDPLRHSMFKKSPVAVRLLGKLLAIDYGLKTIGIIKKIPTLSHSLEGHATISAVLTLQNWRFRFD